MVNSLQILEKAVAEHRAGRLAEAQKLYKQILAAEPRHLDAQRLLGLAVAGLGDHPQAEQLIRAALKSHPRSAEAWNDLAGVYAEMGKNDQALEAYRKAIDLRPLFAGARNNLGDLLSKMGRPGEALAAWRETIKIDPKLPEPYYNIGRALFTQGKPAEAAEYYRRALEAQPKYAPAHNNLGVVYWQTGRRPEATTSFANAVALNPNYAEAWNNLGSVLDEAGKSDEAIQCWQRAIAIRPAYAEARHNLGVALDKKGDRAGAISQWEEALRLRPEVEELKFYLAAARAPGAPAKMNAPVGYSRSLFDEYADRFEEHLVGTLKYQAPQLMKQAIERAGCTRAGLVIDIGCGTGLCGQEFRGMAARLIGVDVAPRMIEKSRARGIYDELILGELTEALFARGGDTDLILAGDVFIYVGELSQVFKAASTALRPGGLMAFSLEKHEGEGVVLRETRRFAHSIGYIQKLCAENGMEVVEARDAVIRMEDQRPIEGMIVVVKRIGA